jgi:biotin carboxyl carrier protein
LRVFSPLSARVDELLVAPGQLVATGEPHARVYCPDGPPPTVLNKAEAELVAAEHDLARASLLAPAGGWAAERRVAEAKLALGRAREDQARTGASRREGSYLVRAPSAGSVTSSFVSVGDEVQGQYGPDATVLFELRELSARD